MTAEALEGASRSELVGLVLALAEANRELRAANEVLGLRVAELERQLGKHSQNSSKPPSSDSAEARASRAARRRGVREAGKRSAGKQPGAPGSHLARVADPDEVVVHAPVSCRGCGAGLDRAPMVGVVSRQVFDVPEPRLEVTEHQAERRRCGCGCVTTAGFPPEATAPACWGPRTRAVAVLLLVRHHLPVERTAELMAVLFAAPVSTGWLAGLTGQAADGLAGFTDDLADRVAGAGVVHADETSVRVNGALWWVHVGLRSPTSRSEPGGRPIGRPLPQPRR